MRLAHRLTLLLAVSSMFLSCAAGPQSASNSPRGSRNVISGEELSEIAGQVSALDAVRRLRSGWLRSRGGSGAGGGIQVYVDNVHAGGLEFLDRPLDGIDLTSTKFRRHFADPLRICGWDGDGTEQKRAAQ